MFTPRFRLPGHLHPKFADRRMQQHETLRANHVFFALVTTGKLGMMGLAKAIVEIVPFEAKRHVNSTASSGVPDSQYWAVQMAAISVQRDRASFMRIYDHFAPRVQRYLRNLGVNDGLSEELVQEALLTLWRKASFFDPARASLGTWLFRIARNLYIDHVRREPNWLPVQEGLDRLDEDAFDRHGAQPDSFTDHDILKQAIDRLPATQAKLVRMCYLETKSHSEISRELDMPLGSVKSSLRRAFAKLQISMRGAR